MLATGSASAVLIASAPSVVLAGGRELTAGRRIGAVGRPDHSANNPTAWWPAMAAWC